MTKKNKMNLKMDLHIHTKGDPEDRYIDYTPKQIIDKAKDQGFDVLSFTLHNKVLYDKTIIKYAEKKDIILIPGVEVDVEGKHVLIYNITQEEALNIDSFEDLSSLKKKAEKEKRNIMIIAPHPYFLLKFCLGNKLNQYIHLFDAIEYSWLFSRFFNLNKKALNIAKKHNLPMIATSDCHDSNYFGKNYTIIKSDKSVSSIIYTLKYSSPDEIMLKTTVYSLYHLANYMFIQKLKRFRTD